MFAPAILPIQATFCVMLVLFVALLFALKPVNARMFFKTFGACFVISIPMLFVVGAIIDYNRYGEFTFSTAEQVNDPGYVQVPENATNITLHKYASGHEVKFSTDRKSLESWMAELTNSRRTFSDATPFELDVRSDFDSEYFNNLFVRHGWDYPIDAVVYRGWRSARGGGFDVWYSEIQETAYISGAYW